jgi:hypothetical protein
VEAPDNVVAGLADSVDVGKPGLFESADLERYCSHQAQETEGAGTCRQVEY